MGQAAKSVESGAGISLGDVIDFCARCSAAGISESTKLRAIADDRQLLIALFAESQPTTLLELVSLSSAEFGTIIEGGVDIDIPGEE
jgi:hypothetical protein